MATIICVDDNPRKDGDISSALAGAGYNVLLANDDAAGLKLIVKHIPSLVLYNITTPSIDRYETLQTVRENYPLLAETLFIFLSARKDNNQVLMDLKAGADAVFVRPLDLSLLVTTIQSSLRQVKRIKFKHEKLLVLDI